MISVIPQGLFVFCFRVQVLRLYGFESDFRAKQDIVLWVFQHCLVFPKTLSHCFAIVASLWQRNVAVRLSPLMTQPHFSGRAETFLGITIEAGDEQAIVSLG